MVASVIKNSFRYLYKDDYRDSDGFHKILFNTGRAIQARELNQLQTIIQREITRFGNNIFKSGAAVDAPGVNSRSMRFVKLDTSANPLPDTSIGTIENTIFTGNTSGVTANVFKVSRAFGPDPAILYVTYINSNGDNTTFLPGETISNGTYTLKIQTTDTVTNPAKGSGLFITVGEGVFYAADRFVFCPAQTQLVGKFTDIISDDIGFTIDEKIITTDDDPRLYDNSTGSYNIASPGADRYRITLKLRLKSSVDSDEFFVYAATMRNGNIVAAKRSNEAENYAVIGDMIAKRTSEESGDYVVKQFKVSYADNDSDASQLRLTISPGLAYVDGYRIEKKIPTYINVYKPRTTTTVNNEVIPFTLGNYILVDGTSNNGAFNISLFEQVNLRSATGYGGSTIGTARVRAIDEDNSGNYRIHLFQIQMNSGTNFRSVRSIGTSASDFTDLVLEFGQAVLKDPLSNILLYPTPKIRPSSITDVSLATQRRFTAAVTSGEANLTLTTTGETFANTNDWIIVATGGSWLGTLDSASSTATISGVGTQNATISGLTDATSVEVFTYINKAEGAYRTKTLVEDFSEIIAPGDWDSDGNGLTYADLSKPDIYAFGTILNDSTGASIAGRFTTDNGQRDNYYGLGRLILKRGQTVPNFDVAVTYDYFQHSVSGDFFGAPSYTGASGVAYEDIPAYTTSAGNTIQLRNVLDFRPVVNSSGNFGSGAIINELPQPSDTVQADISYYNAKKAKLTISTTGSFAIVQSPEALDPQKPVISDNTLDLYDISFNPYTLSSTDIASKQIQHTHYTMKDIGRLEKRIDKLEELTTLSLLELDTANLAVLDDNGLDRTKSGFFVDNFVDHYFTDNTNVDHRSAIDPMKKAMRPTSVTNAIDLTYDPTVAQQIATVLRGDNVYLAYADRVYVNQDRASTTETLNPIWEKRFGGVIQLSPASDNWMDTTYIAPNVTSQTVLDTSMAALYAAHNFNWQGVALEDLQIGSSTNQLVIGSSSSSSSYDTVSVTSDANAATITTDTITTTETRTQFGSNQIVGEVSVSEVIGDRLLQTVSLPFMRSRKIFFKAQGFRPFTKLYAFFGNVNVSDWCRDETFYRWAEENQTIANEHRGAPGHPEGSSDIVTDANGKAEGSFFLPSADNIRFPSGTATFALWDIPNPQTNPDAATTWGMANYTSAGTIATRQRDVLNTRTLEVQSSSNTMTETDVQTTASNTVVVPAPPPEVVTVFTPTPPEIVFVDNPITETIIQTEYVDVERIVTQIEYVEVEVPVIETETIVETEIVYVDVPVPVTEIVTETVTETITEVVFVDNPVTVIETQTVFVDNPITVTETVFVDNPITNTVFVDNPITVTETVFVNNPVPVVEYVDNPVIVEVFVPVPVSPPPIIERSCFVAGTQVTMADGSKKNIEDVLIGEKLLGQDGAINTVLEYDHPMLAGRDIIGINGNGHFMTPEHPLFTKNGWRSYSAATFERQFPDMLYLNVKDLEVGDEILKEDGSWLKVESLEVFSDEPDQQVFNFILDGNNTYFADGLLAHNRTGQGDPAGPDPLAQSFLITEPNGIFLTKLELYFSQKDDTLPMWIQVRPMQAGFPSYDVIPGSTVYKYPSEVEVSDDASIPTVFEFEEPIYLSPGKEYCVVALANTVNWRMFISRVGDFELGSTERKIVEQPFLGSLFKSQNSRTWTPFQWEDMKFKLHHAVFAANRGIAVLNNVDVPQRLLDADPLSTTSGSAEIAVNHPAHGFTVGDTVTISNAEGFAGIAAGSINGNRVITSLDATGYTFNADSNATTSETGGGSSILANQNFLMDVGNVNLSHITPPTTAIRAQAFTTTGQSLAGIETAYQKQTKPVDFPLGVDTEFNVPMLIANAENETTYLSGQKSFDLAVTMTSNDRYVSPVLDMQRAALICISNQIDKQSASASNGYNVPLNYVAETASSGGTHASKHISRTITLAQDAVGLKVLLSANKPEQAGWDVYYRVAGGDANLKDITWTLVSPETPLISDANKERFREYSYLIGGSTGDLDAFVQFQLKIVMNSTNSAKVPVFRDLRAIALSV